MEIVKNNLICTLREGPYIIEIESRTGKTGDEFYGVWLHDEEKTVKILIGFAPVEAVGSVENYIEMVKDMFDESVDEYIRFIEEAENSCCEDDEDEEDEWEDDDEDEEEDEWEDDEDEDDEEDSDLFTHLEDMFFNQQEYSPEDIAEAHKETLKIYNELKERHPLNTKLDKDWREIVIETDPELVKELKLDTFLFEQENVDGVLDFLFGVQMFSPNDKKKRVSRLIDAIEAHKIDK